MPRPGPDRLLAAHRIDTSPVRAQASGSILDSLATIVHWADSAEVRADAMAAVDFPIDDPTVFLAVNQLVYRGAMRPTDLAGALGTSRSNVSKITRRLEEAGLVELGADPADERGVLVALSAAGRRLGTRIAEHAEQRGSAAFSRWSGAELEEIRRVLAKMAAAAIEDGFVRLPGATPSA